MSKISLKSSSSGTATFTIESPSTNTDRVLTIPDASGIVDRLNRAGNVLQVVSFQTGAVATGTTTIPLDDTMPQITEGNEYMTLAITPQSASSVLKIDVVAQLDTNASGVRSVALFQGSTTNALAGVFQGAFAAGASTTHSFTHIMTSGTTSATTFRVRAGLDNPNTMTFNGRGGSRIFGGVSASSITITEIAA